MEKLEKSKFGRKPKFCANTELWSKIENLASVFLFLTFENFRFFTTKSIFDITFEFWPKLQMKIKKNIFIVATQIDAKSGNPDASLRIGFPNLLGRGEQLKENAFQIFQFWRRFLGPAGPKNITSDFFLKRIIAWNWAWIYAIWKKQFDFAKCFGRICQNVRK